MRGSVSVALDNDDEEHVGVVLAHVVAAESQRTLPVDVNASGTRSETAFGTGRGRAQVGDGGVGERQHPRGVQDERAVEVRLKLLVELPTEPDDVRETLCVRASGLNTHF